MKEKINNILLPLTGVILSVFYMPFFLYSTNAAEADFADILLTFAIFLGIGIVCFAVFSFLLKDFSKAAIASVMMVLLLENYAFLEQGVQAVFGSLRYWHILPILIVLLLHIVYIIYRFMNESIAQIISKVLSVIFGALIVVDLTLAIPQLITVSKPEVDTADITDIVSDNTAAEETANIYYFVLDEAASFNTLEKYYNYDAAEFRNALEEYGFFISDDSYNEIYSAGSPRTVLILTNLFNLDYIAEYGWGAEQLSALRGDDCALKQLMTQHGYTFRGIGDTAWLGIPSETSNKTDVSGTTIDGVDLQQLIMGNTFLYPCFKVDYSKYKAEILASFEYFSGNTYGTESTFNFMYICSPHQPFIFDENGGEVPAAKQIDTSNDETYLGQYKFIMKKMLEVIECIIANDPDSVIVISSDHGTRFTPGIEYSEMSNILNAVYFRGEDISEIDGQSSVNTMRIILNRLFGDDLPLVEVPNE